LELESYQIEGQSKSDSFDFNKYMNIIGETAKENNFAKQRTGHLVSFGNISNNLSQQNSNHSSNHSINKRQN
jgi:coenzyme F420-reducing hydrogenase alpha subunit